MTQFELYLNQFNTTIDASAAHLPMSTYDVSLGSYHLVVETSLSLSKDTSGNIFDFYRVTSNHFQIKQTQLTFPHSSPDSSFSFQQSSFVENGNLPQDSFLYSSGTSTDSTTVEDYLAYVSYYELGSSSLVGAFDNYTSIYDSINDQLIKDAINNGLNQGLASGSIYDVGNQTMEGSTSPVWNVYSYVLNNFPERLTDAGLNTWISLLHPGDIIDMKVTVDTPSIDPSIADASGNPVNGNLSYTPIHPEPRIYLLKIHITA